MTALIVLGSIAAALILLSLVRLGGEAEYSAEGLRVKMRVGALRFTVYPMKKQEKPPKEQKPKKTKKKQSEEEKTEQKQGGALSLVKQYLPMISEMAGKLRRKIRIDRIRMDLLWGAADPADCALGYGYANAAIGILLPILAENFTIKSQSIHTGIDFHLKSPTVLIEAALTLTIGQSIALGIPFLCRMLSISGKDKKMKTKEAQ
ncbi:MAG: DUF2953 domain-containing protein [Oscillospiraceae bacterium]